GFVGLLLNDAELGDELAPRASSAGGPVVRPHRGSGPHQLATCDPVGVCPRQRRAKPKHLDPEALRPSLQLILVHLTAPMPQAQSTSLRSIRNPQSAIRN